MDEKELLRKLLGARHQEITELADLAAQFIIMGLPLAQSIVDTGKELVNESLDKQLEPGTEPTVADSDVDDILDSLLGKEEE